MRSGAYNIDLSSASVQHYVKDPSSPFCCCSLPHPLSSFRCSYISVRSFATTNILSCLQPAVIAKWLRPNIQVILMRKHHPYHSIDTTSLSRQRLLDMKTHLPSTGVPRICRTMAADPYPAWRRRILAWHKRTIIYRTGSIVANVTTNSYQRHERDGECVGKGECAGE